MEGQEFDRIWRLLEALYPNTAAKKKDADKAVWRKGLSCYPMKDVAERIMSYARSNKYFPDMADITKGMIAAVGDDAFINNALVYAKILGEDPGVDPREWAMRKLGAE